MVEKWGIYELDFQGKTDGNPFTDYSVSGCFTGENESVTVDGFYDGDGSYKIRFMPSFEGNYSYRVYGTFSDSEKCGDFIVTGVQNSMNHGPVSVEDKVYLKYADGTPYYSIGTTCYAWVHQSEKLQEQTLKTLSESSFNKIRFCIFPKHYLFNMKEPLTYPYIRGNKRGQDEEQIKQVDIYPFPGFDKVEEIKDFDFYTFNVEHFRRFDKCIAQLSELGIEADIIIMHPYDRWGFATMKSECDDLYIKYIVARYAAFRNVWWSMANEYDILKNKSIDDWERMASIICDKDPYGHMHSIHNCVPFYDYTRPWITHCSMQRQDLYRHAEYTDEYIKQYNKPVIWDEIAYEGNIDMGWGNISGKELVRRFWEGSLRGGSVGHGETFLNPDDILWWSHGGVLHGESEPRLRFLLNILKETPGKYLKRAEGLFDTLVAIPYSEEKPAGGYQVCCNYEIHYYGFGRPSYRNFELPQGRKYEIEVIDTWNMTVESIGVVSGEVHVELPGREYMAIRLKSI